MLECWSVFPNITAAGPVASVRCLSSRAGQGVSMIFLVLGVALALALTLMIVVPSTYVIGTLASLFGVLIAGAALWLLMNGDDPAGQSPPPPPRPEGRHAKS